MVEQLAQDLLEDDGEECRKRKGDSKIFPQIRPRTRENGFFDVIILIIKSGET